MVAVSKLASLHAPEEVKAFFRASAAVGAVPARLGEGAPVAADFITREGIDISLAVIDQLHGKAIEGLEVIRGKVQFFPCKAKPLNIPLDGLNIVGAFGERVGVVKAQVGAAAKLLRHAEAKADGLGMTNMQIAIGFRRKASHHSAAILAAGNIRLDDGADEIARVLFLFVCHFG